VNSTRPPRGPPCRARSAWPGEPGADVQRDQALLVRQRHVDERAAVADPGIKREHVHRAAVGCQRFQQLLGAFIGRQIGPHRLDARPGGGEVVGRGCQLVVLSRDDHVETVGGELAGQLTADTAGSTGDDGKWSGISHSFLPMLRPCRSTLRAAGDCPCYPPAGG
jgi:hypothetical protein